ncbi:MAG: hypothetical protein WBM13_14785 [Bacteroidia bacterium]
MKTTIKLSLLALVVFFASCATTDVSIVKRKYNNGYYVGINNHKKVSVSANEKKEVAENKTNQKNSAVSTSTIVTESFVSTESPQTNTHNTLIASTAKATQSALAKQSTNSITKKGAIELSYNNTKTSSIKKLNTVNQLKKISKAKHTATDDQTILLIILSLFPVLALIAMYLKDGKKITLNFWVDLLLHFTFIGYAIFAVLVVLDVFSLA